jgi:RHS repeat-associated protein
MRLCRETLARHRNVSEIVFVSVPRISRIIPFKEPMSHTRMVALAKPHRKAHTPDRSAKDSGLRFYSPEISRWLSRDPITETGGVNLYAFVQNTAISALDLLGLLFDWQAADLTGYSPAEKTIALQTAQDIKAYVNSVVAGENGTPLLQEVLKCLDSTEDVTIKVKVEKTPKQGYATPEPYPAPPEIPVVVSGLANDPTQTMIHEILHVLEIIAVKSPKDDPCDCLQNKSVTELLSSMKDITGKDTSIGGMDALYQGLQASKYAMSVLMGLEETQGYGLTKKDLIKYYKTETEQNE